VQQNLDGSKLVTPTGNYEGIVDHNDPNLPVTLHTQLLPDAGIGVYYLSDKIAAGVSANHLLHPFTNTDEAGNSAIQYNPGAYVYVSVRQELGSYFELMPNVLYKTDLAVSMIDLNLLCTFKDNFILGASFRANPTLQTDAIALIGGLNISDKWKISYSYDITTSALNAVSAGSHEVLLSYRLPVSKPRAGKMINNPRFIYH
jgi:type IX secretion system PorP/SprF family membrane protein